MLTPERIKELSDRHLRVVGAGYVRPQDAEEFARAIEAEVRKDDDALILQLVEALEKADKISGYPNNRKTITAGRARLEGKT